jgi:hypothetical protein
MRMLAGAYPGRNAFHTLGSSYLFIRTRAALIGDAVTTAADALLTARTRADFATVAHRDAMPSPWQQCPQARMEIGSSGVFWSLVGGVDYHSARRVASERPIYRCS